MTRKDYVVLVNSSGRRTSVAEKMEAHEQGLLHRAFSIFIFNPNDEMLLQKRARHKYHFAGLWTNACCSHPPPGKRVGTSASRRLQEELGFITHLQLVGHTVYSFQDIESGLIEHEFDYIFKGYFDGEIHMNHEEAEEIRWIKWKALEREITSFPHLFTPWLKKILKTPSLKKRLMT